MILLLRNKFLVLGSLLTATGAVAQTGTLELGAGFSSEDSYRFGQYSGITSRGGFTVGGFRASSEASPDSARYWQVQGSDLGLETMALSARYGERGNYSVSLDFNQVPRYRFNDGRTPFEGSGTARQTLPGNWLGAGTVAGFTTLEDSVRQVNMDTRRERYRGGFTWQLSRSWELMSEFRHETKQGNETLGAIFGSTGGNPRGAVVARPLDYQTDEFTLGLSYGASRSQYNLSYSAMLFSNQNKALRFRNPFNNAGWAAGANFSDGAVGEIALEPDNKSHQLALSGVRTLGAATRLSGSLVATRLEQDDSYLPYSSALPVSYPLPRSDLDGRVNNLTGNLSFSTRLSRQASLRLHYNYRERDNRTPRDNYQRIAGDAELQHPLVSESTRVNRIYDLERHQYSADLSYRLGGGNRLSSGLEWQQTDRSMVDVATTDELSGFLKWDFSPSSFSSGWIRFERAAREASTYDSTVPFVSGHNPDYVATLVGNELFENDPLLRRYHLTDRDRDVVSGSLNFFPGEVVGVSILGKLVADDYPGTAVGISKSRNGNFAADLSISPGSNWTGSLYYNFDRFDNTNRGYTRLGSPFNTPFFPASARNPDLNWTVTTRDRVHTLGGGIDWELLQGRLQLSLDAAYTDANTQTSPASANAPLPVPGATADDALPDVTTRITSLTAQADYTLQPGRSLSVRYYHENFDSADWALDGIRIDSVANVLMLGTQSFNYSGDLLIISLMIDLN